jgi:hypothetical protein
MDIVIGLFLYFLGIGLLILLFLLLKEINLQKSKTKKYKNKSAHSIIYKKFKSFPSPKIAYLQGKLLIMVAGDRKVVERLISHLRYKNPEETEIWYWEKAIYDLKRDRRF